MRYLSVCSGIEAASVAWHPLGWEPVAFSEIEPFPSAVLAHRWPDVPNLGDMTKFKEWTDVGAIDLLVGGPPCQAFSVAGLRKGLEDARGNLTVRYGELADHFDPKWLVYENVPGLLSSNDNAFGCLLGLLAGSDDELRPSGEKWTDAGVVSGPKRTVAWRILDAQFFGVAQRRRRVFVVAVRGSGNWACASALFSVGEGLRRDTPKSLQSRENAADHAFQRALVEGRISPAEGIARGYLGNGGRDGGWHGATHPTLNRGGMGGMGYSNQELFSQGGAGLVPEYYESHPNDSRVTGPHPIAGTDSARYGTGGGNTPLVSEYAMSLTAPVRRQDAETETLVPVVGQLMANTHPGSYSGQDAYTGHLLPVVESRLLMSFQSSELRLNGTLTDTGDLAPTLKSETKSGDSELRLLVQTVNARQDPDVAVEHVGPLDTDGGSHAVFAFESCVARNGRGAPSDLVPPLKAQSGETVKGDAAPLVAQAMQVRRLTPTECERLQGFPDGHTLIPWRGKSSEDCPDGPRYKALGNSMAVPVMHWIGKRIQLVEGL